MKISPETFRQTFSEASLYQHPPVFKNKNEDTVGTERLSGNLLFVSSGKWISPQPDIGLTSKLPRSQSGSESKSKSPDLNLDQQHQQHQQHQQCQNCPDLNLDQEHQHHPHCQVSTVNTSWYRSKISKLSSSSQMTWHQNDIKMASILIWILTEVHCWSFLTVILIYLFWLDSSL